MWNLKLSAAHLHLKLQTPKTGCLAIVRNRKLNLSGASCGKQMSTWKLVKHE